MREDDGVLAVISFCVPLRKGLRAVVCILGIIRSLVSEKNTKEGRALIFIACIRFYAKMLFSWVLGDMIVICASK